MSGAIDRVIARVRATYDGWGPGVSVDRMRAEWDGLFSDAILGGAPLCLGGVACVWSDEPALDGRLFIYLHGGGYQVGSIRSHMPLARRIGRAAAMPALVVEYRRAPEHVFPAPIDDVECVYDALLAQGVPARDIGVVGDSAGANLALALCVRLARKQKALPGALALMSPWTDLAARGRSYQTHAEADPIHQRGMILRMARTYLSGADPEHEEASPLNADLAGFPATLIQVGGREVVLDDARDLAAKLQASGGNVTCQVWDGMIHVFQQFDGELPEAQAAIAVIGDFLAKTLGEARGRTQVGGND